MKYYDLLGVSKAASADEIKKSFRKLAMKYHPDRNPNDKAAEDKFKEMSEAYAVLSDPEKRKQYDQVGDMKFSQQQGSREDAFRNVDFNSIFRDMGLGGNFDFDSYFGGGGMRGGQQGRGRRGFREEMDPSHYDVEHDLEVGFMDVFNGAERQVNFTLSTGDKVSARIKIPTGIDDGKKLRLKGQGAKRPDGQRGDIYLKIKTMPHPQFVRNGADIEVDVTVPFSSLCLGGSVEIPTPSGLKRTKIKPGMQNGMKIRLKGLGFKMPHSLEQGDVYARLNVSVPSESDITEEKREILLRLAEVGL